MKPVIRVKRVETDRIDVNQTIASRSHNIPGHEERMRDHCERAKREHLNLRGKDGVSKLWLEFRQAHGTNI